MAKETSKEILNVTLKSIVPELGKATATERYLVNDYAKKGIAIKSGVMKKHKTLITMAQGGIIIENDGTPGIHQYIPISNISSITFVNEQQTAVDKQTK